MAKASELYPVITGNGMDLLPENYTFQAEAMSAEKLPFILTAVFSIGHQLDEGRQRQKQRRRRRPRRTQPQQIQIGQPSKNHVKELIHGIIEGMTREEVFKGAEEFKEEVSQKVQLQLNHLGLCIYNAGVQYQTKVKEANCELYNKQKAAETVLSQIDKETAPHETAANSSGDDAVDALTSAMKYVELRQSPFRTNPASDSDKSESSYSDVDEEAMSNSITAANGYSGFWKNLPKVSDESDESDESGKYKMQEFRNTKDVEDWTKAMSISPAANNSWCNSPGMGARFWAASYSEESDSSYSDEEYIIDEEYIMMKEITNPTIIKAETISIAPTAGKEMRFWAAYPPSYSDKSDSSYSDEEYKMQEFRAVKDVEDRTIATTTKATTAKAMKDVKNRTKATTAKAMKDVKDRTKATTAKSMKDVKDRNKAATAKAMKDVKDRTKATTAKAKKDVKDRTKATTAKAVSISTSAIGCS